MIASRPFFTRLHLLFVLACVTLPAALGAQPADPGPASLPDAPAPQSSPVTDRDAVTLRNTPVHILHDQAAIWTSPARIRTHDLVWLVPLAGAEAAAIATDRHTMTSVVSHDPGFNQNNVNLSNILIGSYIAVPVALFGYGQLEQHPHARQAGILSGEAIIDGVVVEQGMKLIFWRDRPSGATSNGDFWRSGAGIDSSFPSSHTVFAWSTAAVIAGEYPSAWSQISVYTLATGVSLTRVMGQQHFPSDVLVGSAAGWLAGHYVYKMRHRWQRTRLHQQ